MTARHEYKHSINYMDCAVLRSRLSAALRLDEHSGENGSYLVRSLYFDTPNDDALREKIDGVDRREKFRVRRYNDETENLRLEKKSKINGLCYKQTARLTGGELREIQRGNLRWMAEDPRQLVAELYVKMAGKLLRPKTIVEYVREAYTFPAGNVRVTLDRGIRTGLRSTDFLSNNAATVPAEGEIVLLEVKYDAFLPNFIADLLRLDSRRASACSKYALSRIYG